MNIASTTNAKRAFLQWAKNTHPQLYAQALNSAGFNLGDFASTVSSIFNSVSTTLTNLAPTWLQTQQQIELLKLNIKRAQQGLTPYASMQEAAAAAGAATPAIPPPGTGVSAAGFGAGLPSWAIPVAIGVGALLLLKRR